MIKVFEEEIQKKKYTLVLQHVDEWQDETEVALELRKRNGREELYSWAVLPPF